jgi:hypothetical protein
MNAEAIRVVKKGIIEKFDHVYGEYISSNFSRVETRTSNLELY